MLICENEATDTTRATKSRLGKSLVRLYQNLAVTKKVDPQREDEFELWQEKWSSRKDQIAQRLALIDLQLEQLVQNNRGDKPLLSLVAVD